MVQISVIMPVYNGEKTIDRALKSIIGQTLKANKYEIIVVNDGSTDKTLKVLETYKDKIKLINQKNKGYIAAAIRAYEEAQGNYVIKLDADDEFEKNCLVEMYNLIEKEKVAFVYSDYYEKDENGRVKLINTKDNIFNTVAIGIMFHKDILKKVGFYDKNLIFPEYDLLIRILKNHKGKRIEKPLFTYYRSSKSVTANKDLIEKGMLQLKEKYGKLNIRGY